MDDKNRGKKLVALALLMPKHEDFMIEQYRTYPEYARSRVQDEFQEYVETIVPFQYLCLNWSALP